MRNLFCITLSLLIIGFAQAGQSNCMITNNSTQISAIMQDNKAEILSNKDFQGFIKYQLNNQTHYAVAAKLRQPRNGKNTFIIIFTCNGHSLTQRAKFHFFTKSLETLDFDKESNKLYVIFKKESEMFGWVKRVNGKYLFEMFEDPEL